MVSLKLLVSYVFQVVLDAMADDQAFLMPTLGDPDQVIEYPRNKLFETQ
jgi:hypothetical protein